MVSARIVFDTLASHLDVQPDRIEWMCRYLGMPQGKRGPGGGPPDYGLNDVARLVIALLVPEGARKASDAVQRVGAYFSMPLALSSEQFFGDEPITFEAAVEQVLARAPRFQDFRDSGVGPGGFHVIDSKPWNLIRDIASISLVRSFTGVESARVSLMSYAGTKMTLYFHSPYPIDDTDAKPLFRQWSEKRELNGDTILALGRLVRPPMAEQTAPET